MKADIWEGEYFSPLASIQASPFSELAILNGAASMSFFTVGSSKFLPINLLTAKIVFSGFVTACLLAGWREVAISLNFLSPYLSVLFVDQ